MTMPLDELAAHELLDALDALVQAIDDQIDADGNGRVYNGFWDDYATAYDKLRDYGRRKPRAF
jgi:hypothetical protein